MCLDSFRYCGVIAPPFNISSEVVFKDSTRQIAYDTQSTDSVMSITKNYYDNTLNYLLTRTRMTDSKGDTHVSKVMRAQDYIPTGNTVTGNAILDSLINRNLVNEPIETRDSLYHSGASTGYVVSADEHRYRQLSNSLMMLDKIYKLDVINPVTNFVPMSISGNTYSHDSRYRQIASFDSYDVGNNISQYTMLYQPPISIIWDYKYQSPIAQVKGAALTDIAYTSFEADSSGNWTIGSTGRDSVTAALTGTKSYALSNGAISKGSLTSTKTYVITYWTKNSSPLTITGTTTGYPIKGASINGWTFYEHQVTGQTTITLSGTGNIDEVRLYPLGAQMTSYTYNPLIGISSTSDTKGGISYYEYDGLQRLINIKDQNGNILKNYVYHYAGQ